MVPAEQNCGMIGEIKNQSSFTRAALGSGERAKSKVLSLEAMSWSPARSRQGVISHPAGSQGMGDKEAVTRLSLWPLEESILVFAFYRGASLLVWLAREIADWSCADQKKGAVAALKGSRSS